MSCTGRRHRLTNGGALFRLLYILLFLILGLIDFDGAVIRQCCALALVAGCGGHSQGTVSDGQCSLWLHSPRASTCTVDGEASCAGRTRHAPIAMGFALPTPTCMTGLLIALELDPGSPVD
jgi:hypothetical protein